MSCLHRMPVSDRHLLLTRCDLQLPRRSRSLLPQWGLLRRAPAASRHPYCDMIVVAKGLESVLMMVASKPVPHTVAGDDVIHLLRGCATYHAATARSAVRYPAGIVPAVIRHIEITAPPRCSAKPFDGSAEPLQSPRQGTATGGAVRTIGLPAVTWADHYSGRQRCHVSFTVCSAPQAGHSCRSRSSRSSPNRCANAATVGGSANSAWCATAASIATAPSSGAFKPM